MKKLLIATIIMVSFFMVSLLTAGTAMSMGRDGSGPRVGVVVAIPALPGIVVLESDQYYFHSDYHYHYDNDRWYYSKSRRGPWAELPRNRYPKEIKYKGRSGKHYKDRHKRDRDDGYDDRRDDKRGRDDDRGRDNQRR